MNLLLLLILFYGCSQVPKKRALPEEELVSVESALNHAQMSYLRGCVDAFVSIKIPGAFETCRDKAILHRQEIEGILNTPVYWEKIQENNI